VDSEVEKVVTHLKKNPKLGSLLNADVRCIRLVQERLKENLLRSGSKNGTSFSCASDTKASRNTSKSELGSGPLCSADTLRKNHLELVRKKFGVYGDPLVKGEYDEYNIVFVEGCPALFWLRAETWGMEDLQRIIQRKVRGRPNGDGGGSSLQVGSFVLARWLQDGGVYRARVESIVEGRDPLYFVRFVDYGNTEEGLTKADLYEWDNNWDIVPPQAVSCNFYKAKDLLHNKTTFSLEEQKAFSSFMKSASPLKMVVNERLIPYGDFNSHVNRHEGPEISVSLCTKDGKNVLAELSLLILAVNENVMTDICVGPLPPMPKSKRSLLQQSHFEVLQAPANPNLVPQPLHLDGEDLFVSSDCPPSPVPPTITSRAVAKVHWWLDKEVKNELLDEKEKINQEFKEPEFLNDNFKPARLIQARKLISEKESNYNCPGDIKVLRRPKTEDYCPRFSEEVNAKDTIKTGYGYYHRGMEQTKLNYTEDTSLAEPCSYSAPILAMQELEVDINGEFQFFVSHVESPDELYVQPVQETTANLLKLEQELEMAVTQDVARKVEVIVGSAWAVHLEKKWFRVRVESVDELTVNISYLDYGHILQQPLEIHRLHRLPLGIVSTLPGLAVKCHMSNVRPVGKFWDKLALQVLTKYLGGKELFSGLLVSKTDSSMEVLVILEGKSGDLSTVSRKLVEAGCAFSSEFVEVTNDFDDDDLDWDPLAEDMEDCNIHGDRDGKDFVKTIYIPG